MSDLDIVLLEFIAGSTGSLSLNNCFNRIERDKHAANLSMLGGLSDSTLVLNRYTTHPSLIG